jgi:hypothetical protein
MAVGRRSHLGQDLVYLRKRLKRLMAMPRAMTAMDVRIQASKKGAIPKDRVRSMSVKRRGREVLDLASGSSAPAPADRA